MKILTLKKSGKDFYANVVNIIPATGLTGKNQEYSKTIDHCFVMYTVRFKINQAHALISQPHKPYSWNYIIFVFKLKILDKE